MNTERNLNWNVSHIYPSRDLPAMKHMLALLLLAACHTTTTPAPAPAHPEFTVTVTGHGPPILFIPGLSSPGSVWDHAVAHLASNHECHVLTLAGFAGTPALPD